MLQSYTLIHYLNESQIDGKKNLCLNTNYHTLNNSSYSGQYNQQTVLSEIFCKNSKDFEKSDG